MGEVYRAEDSELRRVVALKVLPQTLVGDPDRLARFVQEARTASALNHPHVIAIYDIGSARPEGAAPGSPPVHFVAMELVDGGTFREQFRGPQRDLRRLLSYAAQMADALAAAHSAGIVHRDLKPDNVMVAAGGYVKVLDFGLAKLRAEPGFLAATADEPTIGGGTVPGLVLGTVGYMSPEQAQGKTVDHRSDIFSFGCVLYEAACGSRAFSGNTTVDTLHQILNVDPPPLSSRAADIPAELQRIVGKCLAKDPDERYQSMKDVAIDLRSLLRQMESGVSATAVSAAVPPAGQSRRWAVAAAIATIIALAGAVAVFVMRSRGDGTPGKPLSITQLTGSGDVIDAVLSRDSRYLAFVESGGGTQSLRLRQMNGSRTIELTPPSRIGFWGIAFAPDGQSIFYAAKSTDQPTGALYQIPVLGGSPRRLLSDIESAVTFSPDGTRIAFFRMNPANGASQLTIASADGSGSRALATREPPEFFAPGFFVAPAWSPDGRRISAFVRNSRTRDSRLVTVDVDNGSAHPFEQAYADGTFTAWLPDGSGILYIARPPGAFGTGNGGQIYLQPYPSGAPRRVTSDLAEYRTISASADGTQLVSVGFDVRAQMALVPSAGGAETRLPTDRFDGARGMAWTPDGSRIYYSKFTGRTTDIWSMKADGSDAQDVVSGDYSASPSISPDGRTLVFAGTIGPDTGIWRAAVDGTSPRLIAAVPDPRFVIIAKDGRTVFFTASIGGAPGTYQVPIDGGAPTLFAPLFERAAASPDGQLLAGVYRANPTAQFALAVLSVADAKPVHAFPNFLPTTGGGGSIAFTADGSALLYTTAERYNVWKQPLAGGAPQRVTNFAELSIIQFALSPDGKTLVLCRGSLTRDAYLLTDFR
jgi:Tol biopolymer transport system component